MTMNYLNEFVKSKTMFGMIVLHRAAVRNIKHQTTNKQQTPNQQQEQQLKNSARECNVNP